MKKEIKELIGRLYPGTNVTHQYYMYKCRKRKIVIFLILFGIGTFICVHASSRMQGKLKEGLHLYRNEWGEGNYEVNLSVIVDSEEDIITYEVKEREYTYRELCEMQKKAAEQIAYFIPGNNKGLDYVTENINLPSQIENYPFTISWSSSDSQKVHSDGTVNVQQVSQEGENITLTALFHYQEFEWEQEYCLKLFSKQMSEKEKKREEIKELLAEVTEMTKEEKVITLPTQLGTKRIIWKENQKDNSYCFLGLGIVGAMAVAYAMDKDLYKKDRQRKQELQKSYPEFVSMLQLYMAAGLSIRNAFYRIAEDYRKKKMETGKKKYLYEEIIIAGYFLSNGQPEDNVYRKWADRCAEMHYRKLAFLLVSYKRQGNDNVLKMLSKEVYHAWEEQRDAVKKHGEEISTKMLFPMILMLLVVMFLILIPVYAGF